MVIIKNGREYEVRQHKYRWAIKRNLGKLSVLYYLRRDQYETIDAVRSYIMTRSEF